MERKGEERKVALGVEEVIRGCITLRVCEKCRGVNSNLRFSFGLSNGGRCRSDNG